MIWNPLSVLRAITASPRHANVMAARWQAAVQADPRLVEDMISLGRIMESLPVDLEGGVPERAPVDANQLLIDQGRRELALELLALMNVNRADLALMMREIE